MSLWKRQGKWYYRFQLDGKEYVRSTRVAATALNRKLALDLEAAHRQRLLEGAAGIHRIKARTFTDAATEFLHWTDGEHRDKPATARRLRVSFVSLRAFFQDSPVAAIQPGQIESYKAVRRQVVREVTLRHDCHALSSFFRYAIRQEWARDNPVRKVQMPSDKDSLRATILSYEHERVYFRRAKGVLADVGRLILNQGMRPDEIMGLAKADVNLENGTVAIRGGKTPAARRTLQLTSESCQILGRRMQGLSPWVFPSRRDQHKPMRTVAGAHDRACAKAGIEFRIYDLRHTFATRMAQAGVDLATLAAILGHSGLRMVLRYVHPTQAHQRAAMAKYEASLKASERTEVVQ